MLNQSQKRQLKALASTITTKYQLGKKDISDSLIDMLNKALTAHELIKIDVMKGANSPIMELALDLSSRLNAEVIQIVGHVIVLYRQNKEKTKIILK
ncbi:MAG: YhbY family RNA-binding protein [Bacilli bacterium]|nr:YhbY family RNA-binding protein [Bacilli bacterium]